MMASVTKMLGECETNIKAAHGLITNPAGRLIYIAGQINLSICPD